MIVLFYKSLPKMSVSFFFSYIIRKRRFIRHLNLSKNGPSSVAKNLINELSIRKDLNWRFKFREIDIDNTVRIMWVVNDIDDLSWAIKNKEKIGAEELWAGPNLVVVPGESSGIIGNKEIDKIIVPSLWVKNLYTEEMALIAEKIAIWPVGVDIDYWSNNDIKRNNSNKILIYNKMQDLLLSKILDEIPQFWEVKVITYGNYKQSEYKQSLRDSRFMIWLSKSESQGIALLEALSMDIPVLAWDPGKWDYYSKELDMNFSSKSSSCPYFSCDCGVTFSCIDDFKPSLERIIMGINNYNFSPRNYLIKSKLVIGETLKNYNLI